MDIPNFNKKNQRKGGLFMDYMKRSIVSLPEDFYNFVWYIHKNAVRHRLTKTIGNWQFDSYNGWQLAAVADSLH